MITRTHAIISLRDTDESHLYVCVTIKSVFGLSFIAEEFGSAIESVIMKSDDDNNDHKLVVLIAYLTF